METFFSTLFGIDLLHSSSRPMDTHSGINGQGLYFATNIQNQKVQTLL